MSSVSNGRRASGNFFEHGGGVAPPPTLRQSVLILGMADIVVPEANPQKGEEGEQKANKKAPVKRLADGVVSLKPILIKTAIQAAQLFGEDVELTKLLRLALSAYPEADYYAVPMLADLTTAGLDELFGNLDDTFYTKMVLPSTELSLAKHAATLAVLRDSPSIHRPLAIFVPANLNMEVQVFTAKEINSKYVHFVYLEGCPTEQLSTLLVSAVVQMAKVDQEEIGMPYKGMPVVGVDFRPQRVLNADQVDELVRSGTGWMRVDNADRLLLVDVCSTYRTNSEGYLDETWFFAETLASYQYKLFAMEYLVKSWERVIFVSDDSRVQRSGTLSPSDVRLAFAELVRSWVRNGLSDDESRIIDSINVSFNSSNPARIDIEFVDVKTVPGRIFTVTYRHGFNVGGGE